MLIQIENITLNPDQPDEYIRTLIAEKYGLKDVQVRIIRRSLDSRNKGRIVYRYRVVIDVPEETARRLLADKSVSRYNESQVKHTAGNLKGRRVLIAGCGPAGLFCALSLIKAGADVEIFERGRPVEERLRDIIQLEKDGLLNEESNVLFGEGGAGTYSDGKLTTRINRPEVNLVYKTFVDFGAPASILYDAKPHLGTDRLGDIIKNIRKTVLDSGKIYFREKVTGIIADNGKVSGVVTSGGKEYRGDCLVLATGHSARDVYDMLYHMGVMLEKKGFAVGVRAEHPAEYIDEIQYGKSVYRKVLPASEYILRFNNRSTGRGVYSFCMCPGGSVINSSSEQGHLCTNGMSYYNRDSMFSNSAIVTTVGAADTGPGVLSGIEFQRNIEKAAFSAGGGGFTAPAQRITSFLRDETDKKLPVNSFRPCSRPADLSSVFPSWITDEIKLALRHYDRLMKGFISENGILIGAETRSSSPVRILRDDSMQSVSLKGLFPAGEGSGYSGGIVSSAVDGIRAAESIINNYCI